MTTGQQGRTTSEEVVLSSVADRILRTALVLFTQRGYHGTPMERIADAVGVTREVLYYRYASKQYLLRVVVEPLVDALEELAAQADKEGYDPHVLLRGYLDVLLAHEEVHRFVTNDFTVRADADIGPRLRNAYDRISTALTRGRPGPEQSLRAACALGAVSAGVLHDAEPSDSRPVILAIANTAMRAPL